MFKALSGLPCTKSALAGEWYNQWPDNPPQGLTKDFYGKMLEYGYALHVLKYDLGADILASLQKLDTIYSNEKKPADVLPEIASEINGLLKDKPWNKT
jgi:hypothetical protein